MGIEGQGVRLVIMTRQTQHVIQRFDRDETVVNDDGVLVPEKEELQYTLLHHQPLSEKILNGPGGQRLSASRGGWSLSEQKHQNEDKITIDELIYTVEDIQAFNTHSEFVLFRSGEKNNRAE